jgi:hypothetical protein
MKFPDVTPQFRGVRPFARGRPQRQRRCAPQVPTAPLLGSDALTLRCRVENGDQLPSQKLAQRSLARDRHLGSRLSILVASRAIPGNHNDRVLDTPGGPFIARREPDIFFGKTGCLAGPGLRRANTVDEQERAQCIARLYSTVGHSPEHPCAGTVMSIDNRERQ